MVIATLRGYNFCNKSESRKANKAVNQLFWPIGGKGLVDRLLVYLLFGLLVWSCPVGAADWFIGYWCIGSLVYWSTGLSICARTQD